MIELILSLISLAVGFYFGAYVGRMDAIYEMSKSHRICQRHYYETKGFKCKECGWEGKFTPDDSNHD